MLKALIFDVDGTLADTERQGHRVAFNQAFAAAALDWHWDEALYGELLQVAGGKERLRFYIDRYKPALPFGCGDTEAYLANLQAIKTRCYAALVAQGCIPPRPGVIRLMGEARAAGVRLAIATTTTLQNVDALLASAFPPGARQWFDVIAAGDVVPRKKPAPDIYRYALDALGLAADRCLAVEDSDNGLHAARAAGLPTVIAVNGYTAGQDFGGAALVVDHLGEPDAPLSLLAAPLGVRPGACVDVPLLREIHQAWSRRAIPMRGATGSTTLNL